MSDEVTDIEPLRADLAYLKDAHKEFRSEFREVYTAIIGDDRLGHRGIVTRMADLEAVEKGIPEVHAAIDQRRTDGDKRLHERVDGIEKNLTAELASLTQEVKTSKAYLLGVGFGAAILGAGGAWSVTSAMGG